MAKRTTLSMIEFVATKTDWVYFLQSEDGGLIKIGKASQVDSRLPNIQTMSPVILRVLAVQPNTKEKGVDRESRLHRQFASIREYGEWFRPQVGLVEYIKRLEPINLDVFTFCDLVRKERLKNAKKLSRRDEEIRLAKERGYTYHKGSRI